MKNKNNNLIVTIVIVVLVGALAFYGGMQYEKSKSASLASGAAGGQFAGGGAGGGFGRGAGGAGGGRRAGGNATMGQILSISGDTMTVKLQDGSSKIVDLSDKTTFNKTSTATKADFKVGDTVTAFGTANSDGSVTAMMVSSGNGMFRGARGGTGGGAAPSGQPAQ